MPQKTVVVLIHGIRTAAWWQNRVASIIESKTRATVIPLKYGYFDLLRFWCPFGWCRNGPVERLRKQIEGIRESYKDSRLVVFAHSYGTYALTRIIFENSFFKFDRVILCGSIVPNKFDWSRVQNQIIPEEKRNAIINECGLRDMYPPLARSATWGYGATGTYGFGVYNVRDRFHPIKHSEFFETARIEKYWVPAVTGEPIEFSESDTSEGKTPPWFILFQFPVRWLIVAALASLLFIGLRATPTAVANVFLCRDRIVTAPFDRTGYDGTIYAVHYDFSRGSEKADWVACGREYWVAKDQASKWYSDNRFYLVDGHRNRRSNIIYGDKGGGSLFVSEWQ